MESNNYKTEVFYPKWKFFSSFINKEDLIKFDKLIDQRLLEGWELVTHSFFTPYGAKSGILMTFKKIK